jgi:hypothetical protein
MSQATRRLMLVAVVSLAAIIGWRSLSSGSTPARDKAWVSFSCCRSGDVDRVYHPGDTVRVHWIADDRPDGSTGRAVPLTLTARIVGTFTSAQQMKRHLYMSADGIDSEPIHVTEQSLGRHPVSEIRLPDDIRPGLYGLVWKIDEDGSVVSAAGSIKVAAR